MIGVERNLQREADESTPLRDAQKSLRRLVGPLYWQSMITTDPDLRKALLGLVDQLEAPETADALKSARLSTPEDPEVPQPMVELINPIDRDYFTPISGAICDSRKDIVKKYMPGNSVIRSLALVPTLIDDVWIQSFVYWGLGRPFSKLVVATQEQVERYRGDGTLMHIEKLPGL